MQPYTVCHQNNQEENLRKNWRSGNKNYRRKEFDKASKHSFRSKLKSALKVECQC